jgi:hypothetical protein
VAKLIKDRNISEKDLKIVDDILTDRNWKTLTPLQKRIFQKYFLKTYDYKTVNDLTFQEGGNRSQIDDLFYLKDSKNFWLSLLVEMEASKFFNKLVKEGKIDLFEELLKIN